MLDPTIDDLIRKAPKAELHLHIEGTLEPEQMLAFAARNGVRLPYDSIHAAKQAYSFSCLQSFLDLYFLGAAALITQRDFYEMTYAFMRRMHHDNVRHVEMFFDPQTHLRRGVAFETVLDGIHAACADAERELGITSYLIMCFLRDGSVQDAAHVLELAVQHQDKIRGIGLSSAERGNPPSKFAEVFRRARAAGFAVVAHAGEEGPPAYIEEALDVLGAVRIDHGVRCIESANLVERLARERVPLTVCPLSNLALRVVDDMRAHPLDELLQANLCVTVNSDDPAYFGGYTVDNYRAVAAAFGWGPRQIWQVARNGFAASWLPEAQKQRHFAAIDDLFARFFDSSRPQGLSSGELSGSEA